MAPEIGVIVDRHALGGRVKPVDLREFETLEVDATTLDALTTAPTDRDLLLDLLRLPGILQGIVTYPPDSDARPSVVLAWVDRLPPKLLSQGVFTASVFGTLRRAGLTLVVTFRGVPPSHLRLRFDQSFRVRIGRTSSWRDALVAEERRTGTDEPSPRPLTELWSSLDLDPALLPG